MFLLVGVGVTALVGREARVMSVRGVTAGAGAGAGAATAKPTAKARRKAFIFAVEVFFEMFRRRIGPEA
jgi:hypothetical protein